MRATKIIKNQRATFVFAQKNAAEPHWWAKQNDNSFHRNRLQRYYKNAFFPYFASIIGSEFYNQLIHKRLHHIRFMSYRM